MDSILLDSFDKLIERKGYTNRSEAIRDLVRKELVEEEWTDPDVEVMAAVTLVYNHDLTAPLTAVQHDHHEEIICTNHIHVDETNCMEVVIIRGRSSLVKHIAEGLMSQRGVKHGQLVCTTTGRKLS